MNKYKGLKIAVIFGKGDDSCGVTRTGHELYLWARKNDTLVHLYFYNKKYSRSGAHTDTEQIFYKDKDIKELTKKINDNYDIVMFMSYPTNKHNHEYGKMFYYDMFCGISKPIKVFMQHDIHKMQIDKAMYLVPMLVNSDIVFHFDTDTWFSKTLDEMGIKKIGERLFKYTLWMNFDDLDKWRQRYFNKKKKGLVSVTRWSSLKNVRRSIDIMDELQKRDLNWDCKVYGIERSIGAKFDILDYDKTIYINPGGKKDNEENGTVCVNGPVNRNEGIDIVASHEFASSFYSLPKKPENYGNRMEYTQIEIVGVGTIPVFDKDWAENNHLSDGRKYIDVPYSAIYTDGTNVEKIANKLIEISNNEEEKQKYLNVSYDLVRGEFDADKVIPKAINLILNTGKNKEIKSVYNICKDLVNIPFADEIKKLEDEGKLPVLGIGEFEDCTVQYLQDAKQVLVKKIKKSKGGNVKNLF